MLLLSLLGDARPSRGFLWRQINGYRHEFFESGKMEIMKSNPISGVPASCFTLPRAFW
jgi:hypothetical protein